MNQETEAPQKTSDRSASNPVLTVLKFLIWPLTATWHVLYEHWLSYVLGRVVRDEGQVYSVRFVWYGDSIYLHPMVWGSLLLYVVARSEVFASGWPLLVWFLLLAICFLTVIYNFDIIRAAVLLVSIIAIVSLAYVANTEWEWNFLAVLADHIKSLKPGVEPGFYIVATYVFGLIIAVEVIWAWLFNRVELDRSYAYQRRFLQSTSRDPIFARGLKRETKDLLELIILGAADISHHTSRGVRTFTNVPAASLGLGKAIDAMLDYRRSEEVAWEKNRQGFRNEPAVEPEQPPASEGGSEAE